MPRSAVPPDALVHLASGIGNIVMATPLLMALGEIGVTVDVRLDADYGESAALFDDWSVVRRVVRDPKLHHYGVIVPAIPPFYWRRFARLYAGRARVLPRPADRAFYIDEQDYYFTFARSLGFSGERPFYRLPIAPSDRFGVHGGTLVLAPGCKTGTMAAKRWPHFPALAERFDDVALVGTPDDLFHGDGRPMTFPPHVRSFIGALTLRGTAELMASAALVVANDAGLGHVAAAVGTPTVLLFGPTPDGALGRMPPHVTVLRAGLPCEPCWHTAKLQACRSRVDCLAALTVDRVERAVRQTLEASSNEHRIVGAGS